MIDVALPVPHDTDPTKCGKTAKGTGLPCERPAGWGTLTPGFGPCKLHGGRSLVKHGRYSKTKRKALGKEAARLSADPDPLNLFQELAMARALFHDYLDRNAEQSIDVADAIEHVEAITRIVKRIEDIRAQDAISRPELIRVMTDMGRSTEHRFTQLARRLEEFVPSAIATHVEELLTQTRENIADDWARIRVA